MVYVFFVQPGDMMTFDHEISIMQSVKDLKEKVQQICGIPFDQQVLLINGGEPLDPNKNLCSYMAGTDTNPIYLFSTNFDFSKIEILPSLNFDDSDLKRRLKECYDLPASLTTVTKRAQLAQDYHELARKQLLYCEGLVHEQHMQQQGWSAVIANLEDIITEFKKRWDLFIKSYNEFMVDRDNFNTFLVSFQEDKKVLQRIPILETLLETHKQTVCALETSKTSDVNTSTIQEEDDSITSSKSINLFEWISSSDTKSSLDELHDICIVNLRKFEMEVMPSLQRQIEETLECAERQDRKEIEGLGKRLFDLEELLRKIRKYVQQQSDMAQSFLQNQNRASNLRDLSILPDLCATHQQQLDYIREYHRKLMEDRGRIIKAKYELCKSLCARLCWIQSVEEKIAELDSMLVYYHEHLVRLRKHLEVFQQLHLAPNNYLSAVAEVVRRRAFSQLFLLWASDQACHQLTIHNEEVTRRKEFGAQFDGHFLNALFPGMSDLPPPFATEAPPMFDAKLPKITEEDVERLRKELPDLSEFLTLPDPSTIANFFMVKSTVKADRDKVDDTKAVEERLIQAVSDVGLASNLDQNLLRATGSEPCLATAHGLPQLKDLDKGCESETDTEEFEKVGQSPLELHFDKDIIPSPLSKQDASTSTEENLQISRTEYLKLKSFLEQMSILARQAAIQLRTELNDLRTQVLSNKSIVRSQCESLSSSWENVMVRYENQEKGIVENVRRQHELEVCNLKKAEEGKNQEIESLKLKKSHLEGEIRKTLEQIRDTNLKLSQISDENERQVSDLEKQLHDKEMEKEKALKELTEKLKLEHRAEIDNIKSRFRLMTMERSPSNSSLEKCTNDFTSLPSHTTLLVQMTENFELDKQKAVAEAVVAEKSKWEKILEERLKESEEKLANSEDVLKRIMEDKDKQIDLFREREKNLNLECIKYKTTIQQLAECETVNQDSELMEKVDSLQRENDVLKEELQKIRNEKGSELVGSVVVCEGKVDATTSPLRQIGDLFQSEIATSSRSAGRLNIESCKAGDLVLVLWDTTHESFKILQESKHNHMYFLHSDYLDGLGLTVVDGKPNKMYCSGEVIDKEYCHARKSVNRYKVPKGSKFFRVKVKPLTSSSSTKEVTQSLYHPKSTALTQSHMSQSQTEVISEDTCRSLPSSPPRLDVMCEEHSNNPGEWNVSVEQAEHFDKLDVPEERAKHLNVSEEHAEHCDKFNVSEEHAEHPDNLDVTETPEIHKPESVEKNFAEDSGIVENIEQATAAMEQQEFDETMRIGTDRYTRMDVVQYLQLFLIELFLPVCVGFCFFLGLLRTLNNFYVNLNS